MAFPLYWASALSPHRLRCQGLTRHMSPVQGTRAEPARHGRTTGPCEAEHRPSCGHPICVRWVCHSTVETGDGGAASTRAWGRGAQEACPHQGAAVAGNGAKSPVFLLCIFQNDLKDQPKQIYPFKAGHQDYLRNSFLQITVTSHFIREIPTTL